MIPDINAIEERRKRLYKSDADNVYVEDYLADTEFLLNRINDLSAQLEKAKAAYQWIPVTERLPEKDTQCVCTDGTKYWCKVLHFRKSFVGEDGTREKNQFWDSDRDWGYFTHPSVTHWMPLPAAIEKGESREDD